MRTILIFLLLIFLVPIQTVEVSGMEIEYSSVEIRAVHFNNERIVNDGIININSDKMLTEIDLEFNYQGWSEYEFFPRDTSYGLLNISGVHRLANQLFLVVDEDVRVINFFDIDNGMLPVLLERGIHLLSIVQMGIRGEKTTMVSDSITLYVGTPVDEYVEYKFNSSIEVRDGSVSPQERLVYSANWIRTFNHTFLMDLDLDKDMINLQVINFRQGSSDLMLFQSDWISDLIFISDSYGIHRIEDNPVLRYVINPQDHVFEIPVLSFVQIGLWHKDIPRLNITSGKFLNQSNEISDFDFFETGNGSVEFSGYGESLDYKIEETVILLTVTEEASFIFPEFLLLFVLWRRKN